MQHDAIYVKEVCTQKIYMFYIRRFLFLFSFLMLEEYILKFKVSLDGRKELGFEMVVVRDLAYSILY